MHKNEYNTIVVGVAFSPNLKANVFEALRMSVLFDASLVMVHVGEKTKKKKLRLGKSSPLFQNPFQNMTCCGKLANLLKYC